MILFFLLLIPSLIHAGFQDHHDCFLGKFRVLCGAEDYTGPLTTVIWDDNLYVLGGDKKIVTREHLVTKGNPITNPSSTAVDPDTLATFNSKFQTNVPIYTACRNMPKERAAKSFKDVPETVIQLAEEDVDCKNK
ncbi:hypothetical protein PRIPAC_97075 [Pristionchus pacificus]|uniref:Uncharacterized protein n=1 Tax=Pristionchus pacificus TaxID=54126 RepID=A0A2A6BCW7_PRIPA|nr:hypothetical protein PRIPAC_97075 [Pristionchus pacificus]|eukprot:PDM63732.1 hypothetical protein PRIPAC_49705 [Pristionchus pacificus]